MQTNHAQADGIVNDDHYEQRIKGWSTDRWKTYQALVEKVIKYVGHSASGLDLGAGEGFFTKCCQENGLHVIALEGAKSAVEWSKANLGIDSRVHNLKDPLPIEDTSIDFIMCHNVYEHVPQNINKNIFSEAFRVLKPNGLFWVSSTCKYDFVESIAPGHINNPTPTGLALFGKKYGFKADICFPHFNISLFTPKLYDENGNAYPKRKKLRTFVKKHSGKIRIMTLPILMPLWFLNSKFLFMEQLDFFCQASVVRFWKPDV